MTNCYDNSWHDSDDIDSEMEQEAYDLLYNSDFTSKEKQNNQFSHDENNYMEISFPDIEISASNIDASSIVENDNYSDSDCEIQNVETIRCSNAVNALCIALSSDDSECDAIQESMNMEKSFMINVTSANNKINIGNSLQNRNKSFNEITNDKQWSVDYKPIQKNKFSNRYFESNSKSVCVICLKKGHSELECSKSGPVCILCGKEGHMSKKCDSIVCCVCFQIGHGSKGCQFTPKFLRSPCKRCGQMGHCEEICPDTWRQYKYTTIPGPPVLKKCSSQNKMSVICANCAKPGHFTEQCPRNCMRSRFLGPPPVMEIIRFENRDIYNEARFTYSHTPTSHGDRDTSEDGPILDFPSFIDNIDVSMIINDFELENDVIGDSSSSSVLIDNSVDHVVSKAKEHITTSQNGNISLIVAKGKQFRQSHTIIEDIKAIGSSTPRPDKARKSVEKFPKKTPTILPGITTELLKKLFPEETNGHEKLPPSLRKTLRKKLKNLIEHGYLPGDTNMTQERMEFWLQEISTGRALNYREKKKLLSSVSAALHSISDRVSAVDISDYETPSALAVKGTDTEPGLSVPESRRRRNRMSRQQKNLRNELKLSRREKRLGKTDSDIRDRLRNGASSQSDILETIQSGTPIYRPKKRRSKPVAEFQVLNQSQ